MKSILTTSIIMLSIMLISCKGSIVESTIKDANTGTYHLQGTKIDKRLCYISNICEPGEVLSADTTEVEFDIGVEYLPGSADSLRLRDLRHASTRRGREFAKIEGVKLIFNINNTGHVYTGTGYLGAGEISLNTTYQYRGKEIDYILTGEKIDDEVLR